jgi:hypothetical protein
LRRLLLRVCGLFCGAFAAPLLYLGASLARQVDGDKGGVRGGAPTPEGKNFSFFAPLLGSAFAASSLRFAALLLRICCTFAAPLLRLCCAFAAPLAAPLATPLRRLYGVFATHSTAPLRRFLLRLCGAFAAPLAASLLRLGGVVAASSLRFCEAFGAFFARQVDDEINLW